MNDAMTIALIKSYAKKYANNTQNGATLKPLRFTGAVEATYDGSKAVEVVIPQGGGGGSATPELLYTGTVENVKAFEQAIDWKGHTNFYIVIGGTKGDAAISITSGILARNNIEFWFAYYTKFLDVVNANYTEGSVAHELKLLSSDYATCVFSSYLTRRDGCAGSKTLQGSNAAQPRVSGLQGDPKTRADGVYLKFSAEVASITVWVYGF